MTNLLSVSIIDDDKLYQFTIQKTIEKTGLTQQVLSFYDGLSALNFLRNNSAEADKLPDIILLDINMPEMDGWQFLDEYLAIQPPLAKYARVYVVTSSIDGADLTKSKTINGVFDFIVKPIQKDKLIEIFKAFQGIDTE
jgi:CheY-like chemotaxis protein